MATTDVHTIPDSGLDHPVFADVTAKDHILSAFWFASEASGATVKKLHALAKRALASAAEIVDLVVDAHHVYARVRGLPDHRAALGALERAIAGAAPLRERYFARWAKAGKGSVMGPVLAVPRDRGGEVEADDRAALGDGSGDVVGLELRGSALAPEGLRVAYGVRRDGVCEVAADARTERVEEAMGRALRQVFAALPGVDLPRASGRERAVGVVDTIVGDGQRGYQLQIPSVDLVVRFGGHFRMREDEILRALADAVRELELDPVIAWERHGTPVDGAPAKFMVKHFFQVWERAGHAAAAPPAPAEPPVDTPERYYEGALAAFRAHPPRRRPLRDLAALEVMHGARFPDDLRAFLALRDAVTFNNRDFCGPRWRVDDLDIVVPDPAAGNTFEQLLAGRRNTDAALIGAFAGAVPIGYSGASGRDYYADVHGEGAATVATLVPRTFMAREITADMAAFALLVRAERGDLKKKAVRAALPQPRVLPNGDFEDSGLAIVEDAGAGFMTRFYRAIWILQVLGVLRAPNVRVIAANAKQTLEDRPGLDDVDADSLRDCATTALYWLFGAWLLDERETLRQVLEATRESASPLVRDARAVVLALDAGERRALGQVADVRAARAAFLRAMG